MAFGRWECTGALGFEQGVLVLVVCPAVRREMRLTSHTRPAKRDQAQQGAAVSVSRMRCLSQRGWSVWRVTLHSLGKESCMHADLSCCSHSQHVLTGQQKQARPAAICWCEALQHFVRQAPRTQGKQTVSDTATTTLTTAMFVTIVMTYMPSFVFLFLQGSLQQDGETSVGVADLRLRALMCLVSQASSRRAL